VSFEIPGFLTETRSDVSIAAGEETTLDISMKMGFSHETTVTARREVVSLQLVPQNIEVLTATELEESPTVNIYQALNNVAGVDIETGAGLTSLGTFMSINGYDDIYIKKMVDGVDITSNLSNWSMMNVYPQEMMQQVEVIKGGSSSVWGANMGGIINIITKRPQDLERPIFTLKGNFGSFGAMDFGGASGIGQSGQIFNFSATAIGCSKKFGYMFGYKNENNDGFTEYGKEKNYSIFSKLSYEFGDKTYAELFYSYNKLNNKIRYFLDTDLFLDWGYPYYWNYLSDGQATDQVASFRLSSHVSPSLDLETQLKYSRSWSDFVSTDLGGDIYMEPGSVSSYDAKENKIGFTVKGSYNPNERFSLVSGVDYYRAMVDYTKYLEGQPLIHVNQWAPFINMQYRIGAFTAHAGTRYDHDSSFGSQVSPSFGLNYNFLKASLVRVNVGRTFKVPDIWYTLGESYIDLILPNPDLKPERAWAYSVGFESQELKYLWVKVSLYLHKMTDGIVRVPSEEVPNRFTWGNATKFTKKGYEAELGILTPWGVSGYISTNRNDHSDDTAGVILNWIPTRTYKLGLKYENRKWDLLINLRGRWIWWNESDSLVELFKPHDKKWLFDLRASKGFRISHHVNFNLFLDVFNITDQLYWDRLDSPNPRRWAQVGFELKFN
jgi:outer membrane receptor protein involved in Fe transport